MRHLFFLLLFTLFTQLLYSDPSTTAVTENDPSTFIDGVNMITGDFYLSEEDYVVAGAEPITARRFYLSRGVFSEEMPHTRAVFLMGDQTWRIDISEPNGTVVEYLFDFAEAKKIHSFSIGDKFYYKNRPKHLRPHKFLNSAQGVSNTASGVMSAKTQLKNQVIVFDPQRDPKGKSFTLYAADGTIRYYSNDLGQEKEDIETTSSGRPYSHKEYEQYFYRLDYEKLPNGRYRHYKWDSRNQLTAITTTNPKKNKTYARLSGAPRRPNDISQTLYGTDSRQLTRLYKKALKAVISPELPNQELVYKKDTADHPLLKSIILPKGRKISIQYEETPERRVSALLAPLEKNGDLAPYYTFTYAPKQHTSSATDILGNRTVYCWTNSSHIQRIDHFEGENRLHSSESFVWEATNLCCKVFYDETRTPLYARTFKYDGNGNVLKETLWGNLSGQGSSLQIDDKGLPIDNSVERAITKSSYSEDGRNLLLRREEPSGLVAEYTYLASAQLHTARFLLEGEKVFSRTFYEYDEDLVLVREVTDNGSSRAPQELSSVTVRTIRQITPRQVETYIGLPDWIEEKYWDGIQERLLQKVQLHYTTGALIKQKDVYDADQVLRYTLTYKYSNKGLLEKETNALGQQAWRGWEPRICQRLRRPRDHLRVELPQCPREKNRKRP